MTLIFFAMFALAPPTGVRAYDTPDDGGKSMTIEWQLTQDDAVIERYDIYRSEDEINYTKIGFIGKGRTIYNDETEDKNDSEGSVTLGDHVFRTSSAVAPVLLPLIESLGSLTEEHVRVSSQLSEND